MLFARVAARCRTALTERTTLMIGAALVLFGFAVVVATLPQPYWFDEANTISYVHQNFGRMLQLVANDFAPPLYYALLFFWVRVFSDGEIVTALPSLAFAVIAVGLTFRLARQLFDRAVAWAATLLYASSFSLLYYAQETRMYTLVSALAVASVLLLHRWLTGQRWADWLGYLVVSFAGVYTHYAFWFLVAAQNVAVLWFLHRRWCTADVRAWVGAQVALVILYVPWVLFLVDRVLHWYLAGSTYVDILFPADLPWAPWRRLLGLIVAPFAAELTASPQAAAVFLERVWLVGGIGAAAAAVAACLAFFRVRRVHRTFGWSLRQGEYVSSVAFLAILIAVPVGILTMLDVGLLRYVIYTAPLLCCLLAYGLYQLSDVAVSRGILVAILTLQVATNSFYFLLFFIGFPARAFLHEWPAAAQYILDHEQAGRELVLFTYPDQEVMFRYYYRGTLPLVSFLPSSLESSDPEVSRVRWIGRAGVVAPEDGRWIAEHIAKTEAVWVLAPEMAWLYDQQRTVWRWFFSHCADRRRIIFHSGSELTLFRYGRCDVSPASAGAR